MWPVCLSHVKLEEQGGGQEPAACGLLAGLACLPQGQGQEGVACGRIWLANWLAVSISESLDEKVGATPAGM
jgi:hypothetical protein